MKLKNIYGIRYTKSSWMIEWPFKDFLFGYLEKYGDDGLESDIVTTMLNGGVIPKDRISWFYAWNFPDGTATSEEVLLLSSILKKYIKIGGFETDFIRDARVLEAHAAQATNELIGRMRGWANGILDGQA